MLDAISVDTYPFLAFSDRTCLVALCRLIVRRMNLEVATNRLLYQQVEIPRGSFSAMLAHGMMVGDIPEVPEWHLLR